MYKDGQDLILGFVEEDGGFLALGHSTGCKISRSSETGDRATKENGSGKFKDKYVKSLAVSISADGFQYDYGTAAERGYPKLKQIWKSAKPVTLRWLERGESEYEQGSFIITSLDDDGQAGDDRKYSVTFENSGAVTDGTDSGDGSGSGNGLSV